MTTRALSRELRGLGIDPDAPALPGTFEPSVNEEPAAAAPSQSAYIKRLENKLHDADLDRKALESRLTVLERLLAGQRGPEPSTNLPMPSQPQEFDSPFTADRRPIQSRDEISNGEGIVLRIPCGLARHVMPSPAKPSSSHHHPLLFFSS